MERKGDYGRPEQRGERRPVYRRYQGKEVTSTIQAPTKEILDRMVRGMEHYSRTHGLGPVRILDSGPDPDGGYKAVLASHNLNPLKWIKEKWMESRERGGEEREYKQRRQRGEVPTEELSPKEQREQIESARRQEEEKAKAGQRVRTAERKRRPHAIKEQARAFEEAQTAEERARVLETELYGQPLERPEEIIRDRWGKELYRRPLSAKRREEAAKLELAQKRITEKGLGLIEEKYKEAEEALKERRVAKKRGKILGPAEAIARGVAGTVEAVGRGLPMSVRTEPYRPPRMPSPLATPRSTAPGGPPTTGFGSTPKPPDLSHLRELQMRTPQIRQPTRQPTRQPRQPSKPKKKNTYNQQMARIRRMLFG